MNKEIKKVRTTNPLVLIVKVIQQMFAGEIMKIKTLRRNSWVTTISATSKDIKHMNTWPRLQAYTDLKAIATIVRSMDINHMNADLMPSGHQTRSQRDNTMENPTIGITIQGIVVTIVKNMDIFLKIAQGHILEATKI